MKNNPAGNKARPSANNFVGSLSKGETVFRTLKKKRVKPSTAGQFTQKRPQDDEYVG